MTERQLECFLSLAKTLNFSQTAQQMYLTQPAVSQQIRALESDLGVPLFTRGRGGVALTPAGVTFCTEAADFLAHSRSVVSRVRSSAAAYTTLRDISYMMPLRRMPEILAAFRQMHPEVLVRLFRGDVMNRSQAVFFGRNDVSVAFGDPDADYAPYRFTELYRGGFVCVLAAGHPLAGRAALRVEDLCRETVFSLVEQMTDPMLHRLHAVLSEKCGASGLVICNSFYEGAALAGAGYGAAVLPRLWAQPEPGCVFVPLDYPEQFHIGLFTRADAPADVQDFCRAAAQVCAGDTGSPVLM